MSVLHFLFSVICFSLTFHALQAAAFEPPALKDPIHKPHTRSQPVFEIRQLENSLVFVSGAIDIPASRRAVWKIITDCANAPAFLPSLRRCRILDSAPGGKEDIREFVGDWGILPIGFRSVLRSRYEQHRRITFETIESDFADLSGEWRLQQIDDSRTTRLTYEAKIAMPALMPASLALGSIESDVSRTLNALFVQAVQNPAAYAH